VYNYLIRILFFTLTINLMGCSVEELYDTAINYERSNAKLEFKTIDLSFGQIAYLENNSDNDSAIVLLHGFGGDKDNWNRFSAELKAKNHILAPDLPGHGKSVSSKNLEYSIKHQVEMLDQFITAKNIKKIHIAGNSMGGAIALAYAYRFPDKVDSLILMDALGMISSKSESAKLIEDKGNNPFFDICTEEKFNNLLSFGMHKPPYIPDIFMDILVAEKCKRAELEKVIYKDMMKNTDFSFEAANLSTPTLIIWGGKDRILHVDNAALFHKTIKGSQLVILDEFGHVPLLEAPDETAQIVDSFINNIH